MKKLVFSALVSIAMIACQGGGEEKVQRKDGFSALPSSPEDSLFQLVMDGHDIGMAKMGQLKGLQKRAQQALDSLNKLKLTPAIEQQQQALMDVQEALNYAEYSMNTWMEEFNPDSSKEDLESRLNYLKVEQEKVEKVKNSILESLRFADSVMKK
ncbi:hypothetical protein KJS94_13960 [Flavihumibacter rivuli]|uniref:hypothetical protein n=1 Tax=Flavihumibacter rivuli TaxID=2838156 RepID=UPI001BDE41B0|nr:hypothetical protein [Flavihumibacter rivuli]ULQ55749.1 hypothetical protein KJS94_13960 [Flavihumibacter rivuli]